MKPKVGIQDVISFLFYAKPSAYANENAMYIKTDLNTKKIEISKENLLFIDEYVGENPFSGVETLFYRRQAVWQMHYYGKVEGYSNLDEVYGFLKKALRKMDKSLPIRGPKRFHDNEWKYMLHIEGNIEEFKGEEYIFKDGKKIYKCHIVGGVIK